MRRAERLFRLIAELRARPISRAEDLAAHFEMSTRTIYRDIAHLQASGLPIEGEAGVGYILRPGFDLPAMTFTSEQIDALALGLAFVEAAGDESLCEAAREVRSKLSTALSEPGREALARSAFFASRRDGRASPHIGIIRQAIRQSRVLAIHYRDEEGRTTHRQVHPLAIWSFTDGWLFVGWCLLRQDFRAFRLDRIDTLSETGARFTDAPGRNLAAYLAQRFLAPPGRP